MNELISGATVAIQLVKRLREINKNISNAEFANVLADLSIELSNMKVQVADLVAENDELRRKLNERGSPSLEFKDFAYFSSDGDGPFCPGCYDSKGQKIRLSKLTDAFTVFGSHSCPACKETYGKET